jgi:hypothetical protein
VRPRVTAWLCTAELVAALADACTSRRTKWRVIYENGDNRSIEADKRSLIQVRHELWQRPWLSLHDVTSLPHR